MNEKLDYVSDLLKSNPAFQLEISKIINQTGIDYHIDVSKDGNRVVISEKPNIYNRYIGKEVSLDKNFDISDRRRNVDDATLYQYLTSRNHSFELNMDGSVIVNHQGASMSRNMEFFNQVGELKYGLSSSIYDSNGIEMSHLFYTDIDSLTSGRGDKSFDEDRLCREISGKIPSVKIGFDKIEVKPGKNASDCEIQTFVRNNISVINAQKRICKHGEDLGIVSSNLYPVKSENPGLIDVTECIALDNIDNFSEFVENSNNNLLNSTGYGSDLIKDKLSIYNHIDNQSKVM